MPNSEDELIQHLNARDSAAVARQQETDASLKDQAALATRVEGVLQKNILPTMEKFRDVLLERNLPAAAEFIPPSAAHPGQAAAAFFCSDDMSDAQKAFNSPHLLKFSATYVFNQGKLSFRTNNPDGKIVPNDQIKDVLLTIDDLTAEDARKRITQFVKMSLPI